MNETNVYMNDAPAVPAVQATALGVTIDIEAAPGGAPMVTEVVENPLVVLDLKTSLDEVKGIQWRDTRYELKESLEKALANINGFFVALRPNPPLVEMELDRKELAVAIKFLYQAAGRGQSLPILSHVLFEDGKIIATDLDIALTAYVPAARPLHIALPVVVLRDYVQSSKRPIIRITQGKGPDGTVMIDSMLVRGIEAKDFPCVAKTARDPIGTGFLSMLTPVLPAVSTDETRINLSGVFIQFCKDVAIATDGHRLHRMSIPRSRSEGDFLVSRRAIVLAEAIRKSLKLGQYDACFYRTAAEEAERKVPATTKQVAAATKKPRATIGIFRLGQFELVSRLISGEFPDYNQVIPKSSKHKVKVNRALLMEKLDEAAVMTGSRIRGLRFTRKTDCVEIRTDNPDLGHYEDRIPVKVVDEKHCGNFGLNLNYLYDAVKPLEGVEEVTIEFTDELSPIKIEEGGYLAVVMPMRL